MTAGVTMRSRILLGDHKVENLSVHVDVGIVATASLTICKIENIQQNQEICSEHSCREISIT